MAYANTTKKEDARGKLEYLTMESNQIDDYIARFENLLKAAGIKREDYAALEKFRHGLPRTLHEVVLKRPKWPENLDEWQTAAREEVEQYAIIKRDLDTARKTYRMPSQRYTSNPSFTKKPEWQKWRSHPDAMQINTGRTEEK